MKARRAIELKGSDITLELSKVTSLKIDRRMIHLDELSDGTWRLTYNSFQFPDLSRLQALKIEAGKLIAVGCGIELEMLKPVAVKTDVKMIHMDELPNGKWKLIYNAQHIQNFAEVQEFHFIREEC